MVSNAEIQKELRELAKKVATQESIDELKTIIHRQNETIMKLESKVSSLEKEVDLLKEQNDDSEQYSRRTCLRINGVPTSPNESADNCLQAVVKIFKEANVDVPNSVIDRAHRIGRAYGNKPRQIIVKFSTWRHRTDVYKARKLIKEKLGLGVQPDLTRARLELLKQVQLLCENTNAEFAFADVNCNLGIKLKGGGIQLFKNLGEARSILGLSDE